MHAPSTTDTMRLRKPPLRRQSVLVRYFLGLLAVSTFAVVAFSLFVFFWMRERSRSELETSTRAMLSTIDTVFSSYADGAMSCAQSLYQNTDVQSVIQLRQAVWGESGYRAFTAVRDIMSVNDSIASLMVVSRAGEVVLERESTSLAEADKAAVIAYVLANDVGANPRFLLLHRRAGGQFPGMVLFLHDPLRGGEATSGSVILTADLERLQAKILAPVSAGAASAMVMSDDGVLLMHDSAIAADEETRLRISAAVGASGGRDGGTPISLGARDYLLSWIHSAGGPYSCISLMAGEQSARELETAALVLLVACCIVIFLAFILSLPVSWEMYKPVSRFLARFQGVLGDAEAALRFSTGDELQWLADAFSAQVSLMNSLKKEHQERLLVSLVTREAAALDDEDVSALRAAGVLPPAGVSYRVVVLQPYETARFAQANSREAASFQLESMGTLFTDYFKNRCRSRYLIREGQCVLAVTSGLSSDAPLAEEPAWEEGLRGARETLAGILRLDISIGASAVSGDPRTAPEAAAEALRMARMQRFHPRGGVWAAGGEQPAEMPRAVQRAHREALAAVQRVDLPGFRAAFDALSSHGGSADCPGIAGLFTDLAAAVIRQAGEFLPPGHPGPPASAYDAMEECASFTEVRSWFEQRLDAMAAARADAGRNGARETVQKAVSAIEQRFGDASLSVTSVAEELGISFSHFSRLFNERTGMSFPDYVNALRLEKARELLRRREDIDIRQVAQEVGFRSHAYFSQAFKRKYGIAPSAFRAAMRENASPR